MFAATFASIAIPPLYRIGERSLVLRGTPLRSPVQGALARFSRTTAARARLTFERAESSPAYLPAADLPAYHERFLRTQTRKDNRKPLDKARQRADEVLRSVGGTSATPLRVLDLACGDGSVGEHIAARGHSVLGIDLKAPKRKPDIEFRAMNAQRLELEDDSFDAVYTFDSFEHFSDPAAVLTEIARVLRPGGHAYASFGPLWNSPMGPHQWACVDAPYVHQLFPPEDVHAYALSLCKQPLAVNSVNAWPLARFRQMFEALAERFETIHRYEKFNVAFADLIEAHPTCFKAKSNLFDEFVVRSIEVLLRKR